MRFVMAVLALAVVGCAQAAEPARTFKLHEPVQEDAIFACAKSAWAINIMQAVVSGREAAAAQVAQEYVDSGVCAHGGGAVVTYRARVWHQRLNDRDYSVYHGTTIGRRSGLVIDVYVPMVDWTHE